MTIVPLEEYERGRSKKPRLRRVNTNELMAKEFEPIKWIVPGYVPEGFSVLAGRQKLGKTWLAIDMALAVASGGMSMGAIEVDHGDVLYLDLENGERRVQRRVDTIYPHAKSRPDLSRLEWVTEAPMLDKGLLDALEDWRLSVANPRLVIIDVLQRIKPIGSAARNSYENDYSIWAPLQRWAMQHGVGVVGLHHTRKGAADDPLEALSGSNGLAACADTVLTLDNKGGDLTLYVRGRDVDEKESALDFAAGIWTLKGDAAKVRMTSERQVILDALLDADEPMSPTELAAATGKGGNNLRQLLFKMVKANEVIKVGRGRYQHPDNVTPDNNDNKITNDENPNEINGDSADVIVVTDVTAPPASDRAGDQMTDDDIPAFLKEGE